jgi:tetratricopeptide (TPR) repeat protein
MSARQKLRRKLYLLAAPFLVLLLVVSVKMISVVLAGDAARSDFQRRDISALESDVSALATLNVIDPATTAFAAGDLEVLAGRLPEAEQRFAESLQHKDSADSCPVRINLLLVRETLGDLAFRDGVRDQSVRRYEEAIEVAQAAPPNCFAGNDDPDEQRRAIRADAVPRLQRKLALVSGPAVAAPPPPPPAAAPPPPPPSAGQAPTATPTPEEPEQGRQLGGGDAEERLRRLLDDANDYGQARE